MSPSEEVKPIATSRLRKQAADLRFLASEVARRPARERRWMLARSGQGGQADRRDRAWRYPMVHLDHVVTVMGDEDPMLLDGGVDVFARESLSTGWENDPEGR